MNLRMAECPICMKMFRSSGNKVPLILECGHLLCSGCISQILTESSSRKNVHEKCPLCKNNFKKNNSKNFFLPTEIVSEKCQSRDYTRSHCTTSNPNICRLSSPNNNLGHSMVPLDSDPIPSKDCFTSEKHEHLQKSILKGKNKAAHLVLKFMKTPMRSLEALFADARKLLSQLEADMIRKDLAVQHNFNLKRLAL